MAGKVFLNYRREDTKGEALALRTALAAKLPRADLFMDVDGGIRPGENFVRALDERVAGTSVFICLIGPRWLAVTDATGARRLDSADDFVRIEIASALKRDIPIIPVLSDDTRMPADSELPEGIRLLAYKQAMRLRHERFNADADGIASAIRTMLAGPPRPGSSPWTLAAAVLAALAAGAAAGPFAMRLAGIEKGGESQGGGALQSLLDASERARTEALGALKARDRSLEAANAKLTEALDALKVRDRALETVNAKLAETTKALSKAREDLARPEERRKADGDLTKLTVQITQLTELLALAEKKDKENQAQIVDLNQALSTRQKSAERAERKAGAGAGLSETLIGRWKFSVVDGMDWLTASFERAQGKVVARLIEMHNYPRHEMHSLKIEDNQIELFIDYGNDPRRLTLRLDGQNRLRGEAFSQDGKGTTPIAAARL